MTLSVQFITILSMIIGGFYLGMAQDTFRRFQKHWRNNVFLVYVMETSFWLMQVFILYYVLFRVNNGELRFYVFVSCLLGFAAYQALAANFYKRQLEVLISIALRIYHFFTNLVKSLIVAPIIYLVKIIIASVVFIFHMLLVIIGFIAKSLYLPIKWILKLLYRLLPKKVKLFLHHLAGFYSKIQNIWKRCLSYISSKWR